MALDDVKDQAPERDSNAGKTNIRLPTGLVSDVKQEVGVSQNNEVAPVIAAAVAEYIGNDELAEQYEQEFVDQFEEEE